MFGGITHSEIWEGQFIEIILENTRGQKFLFANIYKPPHDNTANYQQFINELTPLLTTISNNSSDFNIDLLKIKDKPIFSEYFDGISSLSFFPYITLPTRFSDMNCTLIDDFLCKLSHRISDATAGILINSISDHLPYFISLDINIYKNNIPKFIQIKHQSAQAIAYFKLEIANANIYNKLDLSLQADPNRNYNILQQTIAYAIKKHLPTKTVKYNKHKHKKSAWITTALIEINYTVHSRKLILIPNLITSPKPTYERITIF